MNDSSPSDTAPRTPPRTQPGAAPKTGSFTGTLRGGILAVGAETTGWAIELDDRTRADVDVSRVADDAPSLDGKRVTVEGRMTTVKWTERGEKQLLIADRMTAAPEK